MTIREALRRAEEILRAAGVPDARLDAEYLLAFLEDAPRLAVCLSADTPLTDTRAARFFALIERRAAREPLQYILGTQDFMGLTFSVTPDVLIPRADTETLCEQALLCAADGAKVLDLCTGSGALGIALKALNPTLLVTAADISEAALALARDNARALNTDVRFVLGDLFEPVKDERFDVIVSNPPYIRASDMPVLQEEVKFEPRLALLGGEDGLDFYRRIAREAPAHLNAGGALLLEIGDGEMDEVRALLEARYFTQAVRDLSGNPRVITARLKGEN